MKKYLLLSLIVTASFYNQILAQDSDMPRAVSVLVELQEAKQIIAKIEPFIKKIVPIVKEVESYLSTLNLSSLNPKDAVQLIENLPAVLKDPTKFPLYNAFVNQPQADQNAEVQLLKSIVNWLAQNFTAKK